MRYAYKETLPKVECFLSVHDSDFEGLPENQKRWAKQVFRTFWKDVQPGLSLQDVAFLTWSWDSASPNVFHQTRMDRYKHAGVWMGLYDTTPTPENRTPYAMLELLSADVRLMTQYGSLHKSDDPDSCKKRIHRLIGQYYEYFRLPETMATASAIWAATRGIDPYVFVENVVYPRFGDESVLGKINPKLTTNVELSQAVNWKVPTTNIELTSRAIKRITSLPEWAMTVVSCFPSLGVYDLARKFVAGPLRKQWLMAAKVVQGVTDQNIDTSIWPNAVDKLIRGTSTVPVTNIFMVAASLGWTSRDHIKRLGKCLNVRGDGKPFDITSKHMDTHVHFLRVAGFDIPDSVSDRPFTEANVMRAWFCDWTIAHRIRPPRGEGDRHLTYKAAYKSTHYSYESFFKNKDTLQRAIVGLCIQNWSNNLSKAEKIARAFLDYCGVGVRKSLPLWVGPEVPQPSALDADGDESVVLYADEMKVVKDGYVRPVTHPYTYGAISASEGTAHQLFHVVDLLSADENNAYRNGASLERVKSRLAPKSEANKLLPHAVRFLSGSWRPFDQHNVFSPNPKLFWETDSFGG